MESVRRLYRQLKQLHPLAILSIKLGFFLMICLYIIAILAHLLAPYAADYFYAMSVYRGGLEAAPASFAAGVCAGLLGDLMLRQFQK